MFTAKCCVLEGSPRYRGGTVVQFAQVRLVFNNTLGIVPSLSIA